MKTANQIADKFGNDGMVFSLPEGTTIDAACVAAGAMLERGRTWYGCDDGEPRTYAEPDGDILRYVFGDGSAIVISGGAWDIEGSEPFSWESESA